jgi:hypothetical protein
MIERASVGFGRWSELIDSRHRGARLSGQRRPGADLIAHHAGEHVYHSM